MIVFAKLADKKLALYQLPITAEMEDGSFSFKVERFQAEQDLYYAKFLVVIPDAGQLLAENNLPDSWQQVGSDLLPGYPQHVTDILVYTRICLGLSRN